MSGATIGGIAGGIIGAFFGNPQLGYMIGSAIGGYVDPEQVHGPRLTDAAQQTARDGVPRAYGYGTFPTAGNLIWTDELKERRNKERAKGGSTEQVTYTYTRSYAIAACAGPDDGTGISGYRIIKRNGKVVYDTRTDAQLTALGYTSNQIAETRAAQAKFLSLVTLYYGVADQVPDPTITAVLGAGNSPGYSYTAYIVVKDDDLTDMRGAVPQYEFVVATCGERNDEFSLPQKLLVTGTELFGGAPVIAVSDATFIPSFEGVPRSTGANISNAIPGFYRDVWCLVAGQQCRYHLGMDFDSFASSSLPFGASSSAAYLAGGPAGWLVGAGETGSLPKLAKAPIAPASWNEYVTQAIFGVSPQPMTSVLQMQYLDRYFMSTTVRGGCLVASDTLGEPVVEMLWNAVDNNVLRPFHSLAKFDGKLWAASKKEFSTGRQQLVYSNTGGTSWEPPVLDFPGDADQQYHPWWLATGVGPDGIEHIVVLCRTTEYFYTDADNFSVPHQTGIRSGSGASQGPRLVFASGRFYAVSGANNGGGEDPSLGNKCVVITINGDDIGVSAPVNIPLGNVRGIAAGAPSMASWEPIPDASGYFINRYTGEIFGPSGTQIDSCAPTLGEIVAKQCERRSVDSIDVSELTDQVEGFRIATVSSSQKNIAALIPGYFFDAAEYDAVLHFPKRGGEDSFALTIDDLVERQSDPVQWERKQEPELLRKATTGYIDPETTWTVTAQQFERRSGTVLAEGESTIELPIVGTKDWAAQVAEKSVKIAWAEPDLATFYVSIAHAGLVVSEVGTVTDEKCVTHRVRIERIEDESFTRMIEARRTSKQAYEAVSAGAQKPLPQFPGSNIRGPTLAAVMNMSAILDSDDRLGLYWAATGMFSNWAGATLQINRAGEWTTLGTILAPGSVGTLLDDLPTHYGDIDGEHVLRIQINDELENVTWEQLISERNALAILYPDHTVEVVQFQNVTVGTDGSYELTTLIRGNLDTVRGDHAAGATVVLLDSNVAFVDLQPQDLGQARSFRVVGLGTDPDTAVPFDIDLTRIWSSTEWPVAFLEVLKDGDDYLLTWAERRRLGTDVNPIRSSNWEGYAVSYAYSGIANQVTVTEPFHTFTLPGASDVDFAVAQLNRLTGEGPASEVNIP